MKQTTMVLAFLYVWMVVFASPTWSQSAERSAALSWRLTVRGGQAIQGRGQTIRLYDEPEELQLELALLNEANDSIVLDQRRLRSTVAIAVRSDVSDRVDVTWSEEVKHRDESVARVLGDDTVNIDSRSSATWFVSIRRAGGGHFAAGRYQIELVIPSAGEFVQADNGQRVTVLGRRGIVTLVLGVARTITERVARDSALGDAAFQDRRFEDALQSYSAVVAAEPLNDRARLSLAATYVALKRYALAIPVYEDILPLIKNRRLLTPLLVQAYLGVGNEAGAVRALRDIGMSDAEMPTELRKARDAMRGR